MNFLFVSFEALSGDLAWRIAKEGHCVKVHIQEDGDVYDGVLDKVGDWRRFIEWADVIVFDDVGFGADADRLRQRGKLVVGGGSYTDKLEEDREFGQNEMKRVGMLTLRHWGFDNFDEGIRFLRQNPGRYVFKPSGNTTSYMKDILLLGQEGNGRDIIEFLQQNKKRLSRKIRRFQIQEFACGVEIAVGAFFDARQFIYPINVNFEHKKLFPGEIGPYTGEMGTLMYWSRPNKIFNATLAKMTETLRTSGYVGYVDINSVANASGIYPLEFTCRFGYPTISVQMEGIRSKWGTFLVSLARGEPLVLKVKPGFQVGAVIAVPPFPYDDKAKWAMYRGLPILFKRRNPEGVHLGDVKLVDENWRLAGESGYALVVTGSGPTVQKARRQMHRRIQNVILEAMFYRNDIGLRWAGDAKRLKQWGYLS